eukprot:12067135-Alexandrium_andersonii.AAC.1
MLIPGIRAGPTAARITGRVSFRISTATQVGLEEWATSLGRVERVEANDEGGADDRGGEPRDSEARGPETLGDMEVDEGARGSNMEETSWAAPNGDSSPRATLDQAGGAR